MTDFYVTKETIAERAELLLEVARSCLGRVLPADGVVIAEHRFPLIAEGYFILNRAYKEWRIHNSHYTERPKIAALQAVVISRLQPFIPAKLPVETTNVAVIKCNEIFALQYGLGILERELKADSKEKVDFWLRVLDIITQSSAQTIEPYITDRKFKIDRPLTDYVNAPSFTIHEDDKLAINSLISIFELLSTKRQKLIDWGD